MDTRFDLLGDVLSFNLISSLNGRTVGPACLRLKRIKDVHADSMIQVQDSALMLVQKSSDFEQRNDCRSFDFDHLCIMLLGVMASLAFWVLTNVHYFQ